MPTLLLLRHGESEWNSSNRFAGWVDIALTSRGEREASRAGELLVVHGVHPDVLHTSVLRRAIRTGDLVLDAADRPWIPVARTWRLNERHYGALQGRHRAEVQAEFGDEQFRLWRRSFDVAPPPATDGPSDDPRYANLLGRAPTTESLRDVQARLLPYWYDVLVPDLASGRVVLVVAHGNSLRALITFLDRLSGAEIVSLNVPTGVPLQYDLDAAMHPLRPAVYLDPDAAQAGIEAVVAQGLPAPPRPRPA